MNKDVLATIMMAIVLPGLLAGGCSQNAEQRKIAQLQQFLQEPRHAGSGIEYRVLPPDVVTLSSHNVQEISNITQPVRPDGKISLPLMGELFVAGMTPEEIRKEVTAGARRYYKKVDVTVYVSGFNSQRIYVFGEVMRPGPIPWTGSNTLLDVLALTQPTLLAWPEKIKVIRGQQPKRGGYLPGEPGPEAEADGEEDAPILNKQGARELTVDLMAMVKTGDLSHNILLQPDDVVYVPSNPFATVGLALQQVLFPARGVADLTQVPVDVDNNVYLHWKYRDRYWNNDTGRRNTNINIGLLP